MINRVLLGFALAGVAAVETTGAEPALRVLRAAQAGTPLLRNGGFEETSGNNPGFWSAAPQGFVLAAGEGRNGSRGVRCEAKSDKEWAGASQTLTLNRSNALPLVVRGWSRAEDINGSPDSGCSLYVDILYADGTPLWGQTANFRTATHDWQQREFMILPEKPVRTLTVHCLLRGHTGKAWFDDIAVEELRSGSETAVLQGVPVVSGDRSGFRKSSRSEATSVATQDGLSLEVRDNTISSLRVADRELAANSPSGFLVRDVAANSDFYSFHDGHCADLGLNLHVEYRAAKDHILVRGRVSDTQHKDRAIMLVFALPLDAAGWEWGDDIRRSRFIQGKEELSNTVSVRCGSTGTLSLYPLAPVYDTRTGVAVALDLGQPAQYRVGYQAGTKQLFIAYDFGLVPEATNFPSAADFGFVIYRFDPRWGFRAALQKYMAIFPAYFQVRSQEQGLWMPFTDISKVQGWQDFGFRYHEGNNNVLWDDAHGILSFRYTEPMTWWMRMAANLPRTPTEALRVRDQLAGAERGSDSQMARVSQAAAMWDESGQACLLFRNEPWCNGAVWSLNPNPALPTGGKPNKPTGAVEENAATVHWNREIQQHLYGPDAKGDLDGEYLDSLEGYVTADLNFRREHFRYTSVPLTFASDTKQPALFKGLAVFEFTHWFCEQVQGLGKLTFANGVPYRFTWLCPWLDVLGTETDWLQAGKYRPATDRQMSLWRAMSGAKPYLLLMNTDYDQFNSEMVERYFQRSLFYGMFPGMFSHNAADNPYWQNPKWYNRDRELFKKYLPIIKRVAQAGWQPVPGAACDNAQIYIERFGPDPKRAIFITLFNDTASRQQGFLRLTPDVLKPEKPVAARELLSGAALPAADLWPIELAPQEVKVLELEL
jgi:hypothetical protein